MHSTNAIAFNFLVMIFGPIFQDIVAFVAAIWGANAGQFREKLGEAALASEDSFVDG